MSYENVTQQIIGEVLSFAPPTVIFGVGVPGSGKSTLLNELGTQLSTKPVDVDNLRNRLMTTGWTAGAIDRLDHQIASEVSTHIINGGVAIIDSTNCHAEFRQRDISLYRSLGARTIGAIWLDTPLEAAIARDTSRDTRARVGAQTVTSMHAALTSQEPSVPEGFDWVFRVTDESLSASA